MLITVEMLQQYNCARKCDSVTRDSTKAGKLSCEHPCCQHNFELHRDYLQLVLHCLEPSGPLLDRMECLVGDTAWALSWVLPIPHTLEPYTEHLLHAAAVFVVGMALNDFLSLTLCFVRCMLQ